MKNNRVTLIPAPITIMLAMFNELNAPNVPNWDNRLKTFKADFECGVVPDVGNYEIPSDIKLH